MSIGQTYPKAFRFQMTDEMFDSLTEYARLEKQSYSQFIRDAIYLYFRELERTYLWDE